MCTATAAPATLGRSIRTFEGGTFRLTECSYDPGSRLPSHAHSTDSITVGLAGQFRETIDGREYVGAPMTLLFRPAGATHTNRYGRERVRQLLFGFAPGMLEEFRRLGALETRQPACLVGGAPAAIAVRIYRLLRSGADHVVGLDVEELLLEMLRGAEDRVRVRPSEGSADWLDRVEANVRSRLRDPPGLAELAREHDRHPVYLARAFRQRFGRSVGEHIRRLRVDRAVRILLHSHEPVGRLSFPLGFYDQSHFTRAFVDEVGIPPGRFRSEVDAIRKGSDRTSRTEAEP